MKRIYKNNDLVFNLSINSFMLNLDLINSIEFKFYTLNQNNYIKKTKEDINEDNQIILQWNELDNLEEGVLFYDYHISISNITMTDGTEDTVTKVMTNYYICNGNSSIDINNDFDYTQYYNKDEIDEIIQNVVIGDIDLSDYYTKSEVDNLISSIDIPDTDLSNYYNKGEVDNLINNIDIPDTDLSNYYNKSEIDVMVENVEVDLSGYYTKSETYSQAQVNELIDGVSAGDIDLTNYYTKAEVDNKIPTDYITEIPEQYVTESELNAKGYLTEHQDLSNFYNKGEVDTKLSSYSKNGHSHTEYVTETELDSYGFLTAVPSQYVTETELESHGFLTAVPSQFITESELESKGYISTIPSEYITESELNAKGYLTQHQDLSNYYTKSQTYSQAQVNELIDGVSAGDIDLTGYYNKGEIDTKLAAKANTSHTHDEYLTEHQDLSNYYTKNETYSQAEVNELIDGVSAGDVDLTNYYTKSETDSKLSGYSTTSHIHSEYLTEHQSLENYYNKTEVNELIDGVSAGDVDLTNYYTKSETDTKLNDYSTTAHTHDEYLTEHQDLSNYALKTDIPTDYLTSIPEEYITESELTDTLSGYTKDSEFKTINGESIIGSGNIVITGGSSEGTAGVEYISTSSVPSEWNTFKGGVKLTTGFTNFDEGDTGLDIYINGNVADGSEVGSLWFGFRSTDTSLQLTDGGGRVDLSVNPSKFKTINGESIIGSGNIEITGGGGDSAGGVTAINIGRNIEDWTQKTGVVSFYTDLYDGSYDVAIGGTSFYGLKPLDNSIIIENAGATVNGNFRCGIKVNPEVLANSGGSYDDTELVNRITALETELNGVSEQITEINNMVV